MTNNFSTIKNNLASKKFYLVRINPARSIMNDLTLVAGNVYTHVFHVDNISSIRVNGLLYTLVTGAPDPLEYSFDETTKTITINLHDTLANIQASGNVVVFYYLFYSNKANVYTYEDPENSATTMRFWDSRLDGSPSFEETQEDIIDGFLSVGNTSITLINDDNDFQRYLTVNDSFCRKEVKIWQCLDDVENIQKFFFGYSSDLQISSRVSISLDNSFSAFNDTLYSLTFYDPQEAIFNSTTWPNTAPESKDMPIFRIYSKVSRTIDQFFSKDVNMTPYTGSANSFVVFTESYYLTNINYSATKSTTTNREWLGCFSSSANSTITEEILDALFVPLFNFTQVEIVDSSFYNPGDNVSINGTYTGQTVVGILSSTVILVSGAGINTGDIIERPPIPFIQIWDQDDATVCYNLIYDTHYSVTTTGFGDLAYYIVFADNFEASFGGSNLAAGLWSSAKIGYRVYNHDDLSHGTILKELVERIGLTVDDDSITAANLTDIKTNFSIPYFGETTFSEANIYLKDLLMSTFGMIYVNNNLEIGYTLFDTLSSSADITEDEFLDGTLNQSIDYKDIKTTFLFENIHGSTIHDQLFSSNDRITTRETTQTVNGAIYLHGIKKQKTINYIVESMANSRDRIINVLSNRRAKVELTTKGLNFDSLLGDDFNIVSDKIIGTSENISIKVLFIRKKAEETNISGIDFYNL